MYGGMHGYPFPLELAMPARAGLIVGVTKAGNEDCLFAHEFHLGDSAWDRSMDYQAAV